MRLRTPLMFVALLALAAAPGAASAQTGQRGLMRGEALTQDVVAAAVDEASARFGLPAGWIHAVIQQESRGDPRAVSPKGAMGLLQLMPATWREMTAELQLGDDPFEPRANILAGAGYLRRMYDQFGAPGFLAAYNAGPSRYARSLVGAADLPPETRRYLARLAPAIVLPARRPRETEDWRASALFTGAVATVEGPAARGGGVWP